MKTSQVFVRAVSKFRRTVAKYIHCKIINVNIKTPIISFSFDDATRTAFFNGGGILEKYSVNGTFYVSFGLLGSSSPSGAIGTLSDLKNAVKNGHELGCHTFDHLNSWNTKTKKFTKSVLKNSQALSNLIPDTVFTSFSYPICEPRPTTKKLIGKLFSCCRGGDQKINIGKADLNLLSAYFLDVRNGDTIGKIKKIIDKNTDARGWLIFATHDVVHEPSRYGCSKKSFDEVVKYAAESGGLILPVGEACKRILLNGK
jgi:peptidoglycan/xylan/chitin deacetylase (PgdA/CDA1 family)